MSTIHDLITQIDPLWQQLKTLAVGTPIPAPVVPTLSTAAALSAACAAGGSYLIAPGSYVGNFVLTKPITLTGTREAILSPADLFQPTVHVSSSDVVVDGVTILNGAPGNECVVVGRPDATDAAQQPNTVTLSNLAITAGKTGGHRGLALHGSHLSVINCQITNFWLAGQDAQAIWIGNGPGPYTIDGCYCEGSGENIISGGSDLQIPNCVPSDITIRNSTFYKPDTWRTNGATVKNLLEIKIGRRVLIENNVFDGCWVNGQDGTPILFTTRNQDGGNPWAIVDEVTFRGNTIQRAPSGYACSILGADDTNPSQQTRTMLFEHNLWRDAKSGFKIGNGVSADLTIRNNTMPAITGNFLSFYDTRSPALRMRTPLTFVNNVVASGQYGISSAEYGVGIPTLTGWCTSVFARNVIQLTNARTILYPGGNTLVPAGQLAALLDPVSLKLLSGSAGY